MNLRQVLLKYFLPFVAVFLVLSILSMLPVVQKIYYPLFEKMTLSVLSNSMEDVYFKPQPKKGDADYNEAVMLFQSKRTLTQTAQRAKARGKQAQYNYLGFNVKIDETFMAPLIFFFSLLLFTPGSLKQKLFSFVIGSLLILGFAGLIVFFKGQYMVNKSEARDFLYTQNDLNFFKTMHFFFSPVTIITIVLIVWALVAFRKSDLKRLFI